MTHEISFKKKQTGIILTISFLRKIIKNQLQIGRREEFHLITYGNLPKIQNSLIQRDDIKSR